jgi:hypothetical protein
MQAGPGRIGAIVHSLILPDLARDFLARCQLPGLFSTSVKLTRFGISRERWLLTLPQSDFHASQMRMFEHHAQAFVTPQPADGPGHDRRVQSGKIAQGLSAISRRQEAQTCLHIGYVKEGAQEIRKLYYEFDPVDDATVFIALKSKMGSLDIHRYDMADPYELVSKIPLDPEIKSLLRELLRNINQPVHALHVHALLSSRQSLDLNLSDVEFTPELRNLLLRLLARLQPSAARDISETYARPTHLAFGQNAAGADFLTVYGEAYWVDPDRIEGQKA